MIVVAHIALMILGWGILIPLGIAIAALCKRRSDWFDLHRGFQIAGFLFGTVGAVLGIIKSGGIKFTGPHHIVGLLVTFAAVAQPINGMLRPHKPSAMEPADAMRTAWEILHKGFGYLLAIVAVGNIVLGALFSIELYAKVSVCLALALPYCLLFSSPLFSSLLFSSLLVLSLFSPLSRSRSSIPLLAGRHRTSGGDGRRRVRPLPPSRHLVHSSNKGPERVPHGRLDTC